MGLAALAQERLESDLFTTARCELSPLRKLPARSLCFLAALPIASASRIGGTDVFSLYVTHQAPPRFLRASVEEEDGEKPSSLLVLRKGGVLVLLTTVTHSFCPFVFPGLLLDHHLLPLRDHDGEVGGRIEGYWDCLGGGDPGIGTQA